MLLAEGRGHRPEAVEVPGGDAAAHRALDRAQRPNHALRRRLAFPGQADQQRAPVVAVEGALDQAAGLQPVEDAAQRRGAVVQTALQLADGLRRLGREQRQDVRLTLGDAQVGEGGLQVEADGVGGPLQLEDEQGPAAPAGRHAAQYSTDTKYSYPWSAAVTMDPLDLDDDEFLARFEAGAFSAAEFRHRAHLRMAYLYGRRHGVDAAVERATAGIRHLAAAHGHTALYHDTLTRAWVQVVALCMARTGAAGFDELIAAHPALLDKHLLLGHYSRGVLFGADARAHWVEPDLLPIPLA